MIRYFTHEVEGVLVLSIEESPQTDIRPSTDREALYAALQSRTAPRLAVDLGSVDYLASADIGFLISLKRRIEGLQGRIVLFQVQPFVLELLRTMRLQQFFPIADDLPDALGILTASG